MQIGVLGHPGEPFTSGTLAGIETIVSWLDSWGVPRRWPAGRPEGYRLDVPASAAAIADRRSRVAWARGGHFGASQVPGCDNAGPGAIDIDRITGPHGLQVRAARPPRSARGGGRPHPGLTPAWSPARAPAGVAGAHEREFPAS